MAKLQDSDRGEGYRATLANFKDFLESAVWWDIKRILEGRLYLYRQRSISKDATENMEDVRYIQGAAEELESLIDLPEAIMDDMEAESE